MLLKFNPNNFESEIEGLYLCGTVLAGIYTEKVFIENGREHAKAIAADILKVSSVVNI
jgi:thioredoxin reductase (NADPH)